MNGAIQLGLDFLFNAAWQLVIIAVVALAADRLMGGTPRLRHMVWVAALVISLSLPLLSAVPRPKHITASQIPPDVNASLAFSPDVETAIAPPVVPGFSFHVSRTIAMLLVFAFLAGFAWRCFQILKACWRTMTIRREAKAFELDANMRAIVDRCQRVFEVNNCAILKSASLRTPAAVGIFKPALILPEQLIHEGDASALTAAVGHELAHVRRRDYLCNLIYELVFLPLSVHPAAHFIKRRITQTRELRCDELVTERLLHPDVYARSLVRLAAWSMPFDQRTQSIMVGMADADILEVRVMSLLKKTRSSVKRNLLLSIAGVALLAIPCAAAASWGLHLHVDEVRAQEPAGGSQERRKLTDEEKLEAKKHYEAEVQELKQKIADTTDREVKERLERQLQDAEKSYTVVTREGGGYVFTVNSEGQRREREMQAKHNSILAGLAKIPADQAIQIATSKTPGKVLECTLIGERWFSQDENAKPSLVLYHVVILSGDENAPVTNHVLVNAVDGSIFKAEREERRRENPEETNQNSVSLRSESVLTTRRGIEGGVLNGKAVSLPPPEYPDIAKSAHASGSVQVKILIDESGSVVGAEAVSGHPLLRAAAVSAAREARFTTTRLEGEPVKVSGVLVYNFVAQ
ncbi:MAG TPA: TonB family protein [Pyrinomonadaceae bacterium]|nr:TonB family protein [Pyrinomonadaceae bacterium]